MQITALSDYFLDFDSWVESQVKFGTQVGMKFWNPCQYFWYFRGMFEYFLKESLHDFFFDLNKEI